MIEQVRMNSSSRRLTRSTWWSVIALNIVLSIVFQYFWLYKNFEWSFYLWGFPILPSVIISALISGIILLRNSTDFFLSEVKHIGSIWLWIAALFFPLIALALAAFIGLKMNGLDFEVTRQWNALAASTLFDLPVVFVWLLPMLLLIELTWRFWFRINGDGRNGNSWRRAIASSAAWLLMNIILLNACIEAYGIRITFAFALYLFSSGCFLFRMQSKSSIYTSSLSLLLLLFLTILIFGNDIQLPNHILFGQHVASVEGILSGDENAAFMTLISASALFILFAFLLRMLPTAREKNL